MVTIVYLPANSAWAFCVGANLENAELLKLDGYPMFYNSRQAAAAAARAKGMEVL